MNGAEQIGPVLRGGLPVAAGPEQDRLVALGHIGAPRAQVDDELVHADPADARSPPAVDQHLQPVAQRPEDAVGITDR
jgi:hypothetical protein